MSNTKIVSLIVGGGLLLIGLIVTLMYFSYNSTEVELRKQAEAQRGKVEGTYDVMWKTITQQASVSEQYKDAFKEIYPELIEGRYSQGDGSLMKWIQESNPTFDTSLYKKLMQTIEVQRLSFETKPLLNTRSYLLPVQKIQWKRGLTMKLNSLKNN